LLGSTEWVETHAELLRNHAVAYINGDDNARGFFRAAGSHTLEKFINEIAREVIDPEKKIPVAERARAKILANSSPEDRREIRERADLRIRALGSGSDFSPFLQHLGIPSLDLRYSGEGEGGSYHSIYDSFEHYTRFIDPTFDYGVALAQTSGRAVLRLACAEVLPFEFTSFAETVARYAKEVVKLADDMRTETREHNRLLNDKTQDLAADPTRTFVPPDPKSPVPYFNFAPLQNAVELLRTLASRFENQLNHIRSNDHSLSLEKQRALDQLLMRMESALTREQGLPGRPWYKHLIYAPGLYTGYGVKTLPAIREAIEQRQWNEVNEQIEITAKVLERFSDQLDRARRLLSEEASE
jgi:N-acetylated-alpha-linked acidic dipeptidase